MRKTKTKKRLFTALWAGCLLLGLGFFVLLCLPHWFYHKAITRGIHHSYLHLPPSPQAFSFSTSFEREEMKKLSAHLESDELWHTLPLGRYQVPFPLRHPYYKVIPSIKWKNKKTWLGYRLQNYNKKEIASVRFLGTQKLQLYFEEDKLFQIPLFKSELLSQGNEKLWEQVFTLQLQEDQKRSLWGKFNWREMIKNLFALSNRHQLLPPDTRQISYWPKKKWGIVEVIDDETHQGRVQQYHQEVIYFVHQDQIHKIQLRTLKENALAKKFRYRFLEELHLLEKDPSHQVKALYEKYKKLKYKKKTEQEGMIYALSAWSQSMDNKKYLQEMIFYLERGKQNKSSLFPIYRYGYKRWGKSFSQPKKKDQRKKKSNRRVSNEFSKYLNQNLEKEYGKIEKDLDESSLGVEFSIDREKAKLYLEE